MRKPRDIFPKKELNDVEYLALCAREKHGEVIMWMVGIGSTNARYKVLFTEVKSGEKFKHSEKASVIAFKNGPAKAAPFDNTWVYGQWKMRARKPHFKRTN